MGHTVRKYMKKKLTPFWIITIVVVGVVLVGGILEYRKYQSSLSNISTSNPVVKINANNGLQLPERNYQIGDFTTDAKSAMSVEMDNNGQERVLFEKNIDEKLLIASITKLMTAAVVLENYDLSQTVKIGRPAVLQGGLLNVGDTFSVDTLLHMILIAPDNTAAYTLGEIMGKQKFVGLMNLKAKEFGLSNTNYVNSVGYGLGNHSTARDLVSIAFHLLKQHPEIFTISSAPTYDIYNVARTFHYKVTNADKLLAESTGLKDRIIGGKLGENNVAGGCLLLVFKSPDMNEYIINVILDSKLRFTEMKELVDWTDTAYKW
jgi:serine-type D-Ala-D-Ala carboxypeptidase (penicillin-binding protein 5/6)